MNWSEADKAIQDARRTMSNADRVANQMASILIGRLRHVSVYRLQELKRELQDFNAHTKTWKS